MYFRVPACYASGATAAYGSLNIILYLKYGSCPLGNGHLYKGVSCHAFASTPFILAIILASFLVFFSLLFLVISTCLFLPRLRA